MALKFVGQPKLIPLHGMYELIENLHVVYTTDDGEIKAVLVPKGYRTDGATIPRLFWSSVGSPFDPKFMLAAIVHDWHCNIRDGKIACIRPDTISVDEMSDLFFELLIEGGVSLAKGYTMEFAVRTYKTLF